jgi:hypothetical protein
MISNDSELEQSMNGGGLGAMIQELANHSQLIIIDRSLSKSQIGQEVLQSLSNDEQESFFLALLVLCGGGADRRTGIWPSPHS